uniref:Rab5-interacting protein n=1 Tax=Syphacia muris TaxID=451379 RepID=A0A0N5APQ6_9BILA
MQKRCTQNNIEVSTWKKTLAKSLVKSDWPDKDELLDVIYWGRQILGLLIGIIWGTIPLHGLFAIILYVSITTIAGQFYVSNFQKVFDLTLFEQIIVDEDAVGGFWELAKEGFGAAFATFMVAWITVYSAAHYN